MFLIITPVMAFAYVASQHYIRRSADFPQVTIASDKGQLLAEGADPSFVVGSSTLAMDQTLDTFIMVFNNSGTLVASNVKLHDKTPVPPQGVFDFTQANGQDLFTWQPSPGVRNAVVIQTYSGIHPGFILVGRSLREVESDESWVLSILVSLWIAFDLVAFLISMFLSHKFHINISMQNHESHTI